MEKWTYHKDYMGEDFSEYYVFIGRHRDSGCLDNSNFEVALERLKSVSEDESEDSEETKTVKVVSFGHWAVGWLETILIHESDKKAIKLAEEMEKKLRDYPILDEDDFSRREWEMASDVWKGFSLKMRVDACSRYGCSIFAARRDEVPNDDRGGLFQMLTE